MTFESLHAAELEWIIRLQKLGDWGPFMKVISAIGPSKWLLGFIGLVYLCINARIGARLALLYFAGDFLTFLIKIALGQPRPFWMDKRVFAFEEDMNSYGFPSGHALVSLCTYFLLAHAIRRWWAYLTAGITVFLISISRVYLGSHFISDVIGGGVLGVAFLVLFLKTDQKAQPRWNSLSLAQQIILCVTATLILVNVGFAVYSFASPGNALQWVNYPGPGKPLRALGFYCGALGGLGIGLSMASHSARFDAGGTMRQRLLRVVVVGALVGIYLLRPKSLLKGLPDPMLFLIVFPASVLAGWAFTFAIPWVFLKFGLADSRKD